MTESPDQIRNEDAPDGATYRPNLKISGPDHATFLIDPFEHGCVWKIRNRGLTAIRDIRFEIASARSFDASHPGFRDPIVFDVPWMTSIKGLAAGEETKNTILVRIEGDSLGFGNLNRSNLLPWPKGDPSASNRWLLIMRVVGLSKEWPIELDIRWTRGTKILELRHNEVIVGSAQLPNPIPADHPLHEAWEKLPREACETVSRAVLEGRGQVLNLDMAFQEKFADTPSLDLLEKYCLRRFDLIANQLVILSISADPTSLNPLYEEILETLEHKEDEGLSTILQSLRSEVREKIVSRISLKLSSRKLNWLREAVLWRLQGCPPRSPLDVKSLADEMLAATVTGSSLDDYLKGISVAVGPQDKLVEIRVDATQQMVGATTRPKAQPIPTNTSNTDRDRQQPDGTFLVESEYGQLDDVVKHSVTLCHVLEARAPAAIPGFSPPTAGGEGSGGNEQVISASSILRSVITGIPAESTPDVERGALPKLPTTPVQSRRPRGAPKKAEAEKTRSHWVEMGKPTKLTATVCNALAEFTYPDEYAKAKPRSPARKRLRDRVGRQVRAQINKATSADFAT